ncbi:MAG: hypothetical protein AB7O68_08185 [Pirellulales bacterium]
MPRGISDALLSPSVALAASSAAPSYSDAIATGQSARGSFVAPIEFELALPALNVTQLPNGETSTITVETDADESFGSPTMLCSFEQVGAGGAGAAAASHGFGLPNNVERFIRLRCTVSAGAGDCSAATASLTFRI